MARFVRVGLTVGALLIGLSLAGCEDFDPTAILDSDLFNTKKKLPGDRIPVFPEGTPGVPQGVPPELVKGYQPPPEPATAAKENSNKETSNKETSKQAAAEPTELKPKPKPKPKPNVAAKPVEQTTASAAPAPPPASQPPQSPDQSQTQQAPAAAAAWPDPPAPR